MKIRKRRHYESPLTTTIEAHPFILLTTSDVDAGSDIHDWDSGEGGSGNIEI